LKTGGADGIPAGLRTFRAKCRLTPPSHDTFLSTLPNGGTRNFQFAATPKGKKVTVRAELTEVDGRKLRFKVEAHDEDRKVGEGTHRRAVVPIQRKA